MSYDEFGVREQIERRIDEFLRNDDRRRDWIKAAVRTHQFLPLYLGWLAVLGIRPDGSLVRWDHEDAPEIVSPLSDPYWQRMALCQGSKRYPELSTLIPQRPMAARVCDSCAGTGTIEKVPSEIICQCGGLGWIIPGERHDRSPG
jgi:hypothetical protein